MKSFIESNNIKAVLFDMDGLMFDTERLYTETWYPAARSFGYEVTPEMLDAAIGLNSVAGQKLFAGFLGDDFPFFEIRNARLAISDAIIREKGVPVKPGLYALLDYLDEHGIKKAVATSSERARAEMYLRSAGIEGRFDGVVCGDEVQNSKPDPEIFLKAAAKTGIAPSDCMVLEDSFSGIRAAKAGGMHPVMIPDTLQPTEEIRALCEAVFSALWDEQ